MCSGFQPVWATVGDRLRAGLRRGDVEERVGLRRGQLLHLRRDGGVGRLVALLGDDRDPAALDALGEAAEQVLAEAVVLVEHRDLGVRLGGLQVFRVDLRLGLVRGLPAGRVRELRLVRAEDRGAGGHEQLRHLVLVEVVAHGEVVRGAERVDDREDLVLLDQPLGVRQRALRLVPVVVGDELDLAAVDAAVVVELLEEAVQRLGNRAVRRGRAAERIAAAELDGGVGDAGSGAAAAATATSSAAVVTAAGREQQGRRQQGQDHSSGPHRGLLAELRAVVGRVRGRGRQGPARPRRRSSRRSRRSSPAAPPGSR